MRSTDPKLTLDRLRAALESVAADLVELEIDADWRLLQMTSLEGVSADRVAAAGSAVTELWRRKELLEELLEQADRLRRSRKNDELHELLGSPRSVEGRSPDDLLAEMASSFTQVKAVISQITGIWATLNPRLDRARSALDEAGRLADQLGEPARVDVDSATLELAAISRAALVDPLSVDSGDVDRMANTAVALRDDLQADLALRGSFEARTRESRELVSRLAGLERDVDAAQSELAVKIAGASVEPLTRTSDNRAAELDGVLELAGAGHLREARKTLEAVRARTESGIAEAKEALDAARAPVQARNQLRGLLDAYQAKAKRTGRLEDPRVAEIFSRAQECLYAAPMDLALATRLVRSYQEALQGSVSDAGAAL